VQPPKEEPKKEEVKKEETKKEEVVKKPVAAVKQPVKILRFKTWEISNFVD
jgi:hypothetical protein